MKITFKSGPIDTIEGDEVELVHAMKAMSTDLTKISEHDRVVLHNSVLTQMVETLERKLRRADNQLDLAGCKNGEQSRLLELAQRTLLNLGYFFKLTGTGGTWVRQPGWADRGFASGGVVPPRAVDRQTLDSHARVRMARMSLASKVHAAAETLERMNFSYTEGAQLWKPPVGTCPFEEGKVYDSSTWTGRKS